MNDQTTQDPQVDLSDDEIAAALGYATSISEKTMFPPMPEETPEAEAVEEPEPEVDMGKELESFKKEIKDEIKNEIGSIRDMIAEALTENEQDEA